MAVGRRDVMLGENVYSVTFWEGKLSSRFLTQIQGTHGLWNWLDSLSHVFEDTAREWFLPTAYSSALAVMLPSGNQDNVNESRAVESVDV